MTIIQVLSADVGEDAECHAAKLLEVVLLQCPGQVDQVTQHKVSLTLSAFLEMKLLSFSCIERINVFLHLLKMFQSVYNLYTCNVGRTCCR